MKTFLDGVALEVDDASLAGVLEVGAAEAERNGRVIIEASVDGHRIDEDQLVEPSSDPIQGEQVHLISADPRALVATTLFDARDALSDAKQLQDSAAASIQAGEVTEALQPLAEAIGTWQIVRDVIDKSALLLGFDLNDVKLPTGKSIADAAGELVVLLGELRNAMASEDWASVADVLAYELDGQVAKWQEILGLMGSQIRG